MMSKKNRSICVLLGVRIFLFNNISLNATDDENFDNVNKPSSIKLKQMDEENFNNISKPSSINVKQKAIYSPLMSIGIGITAGGLEAFLTHPLVTLKALSQNNTPLNMKDYWDIKKGVRWSLSNTENLMAVLYRGVYTNVIGMSSIIATRILVRDSIIEHVFKTQEPSMFQHMIGAAGAGFVSAAITTPMELGMTLQQTDELKKKTTNFISNYKNVIDKFGIRHGFTGLTCVGLRDTLVTASFLTFSSKLKEILRDNLNKNDIEVNDRLLQLFSGIVAGTTCSILTHPLDTIKTVQQAKLRSAARKEECSISSVAKFIYKDRGINGYYKGLFWRTARVAPHIAIIAFVKEHLTSIFNRD